MNTSNTYLRFFEENSDDQEEFDGQEIFVSISSLTDSGVPIDDFDDDMESDGFLYKKTGKNYQKISWFNPKLSYLTNMNTQIEPRSPFKANSIWNSARAKTSKQNWSFKNARNRGKLPELPAKIKQIGFRTGIYQWGQYRGSLEDLKEFARFKGVKELKCGAIKYKVA